MVSDVIGAETLRSDTHACVARARAIDIRAYEGRDIDVICDELAQAAREVVEAALAICRRALDLFDDEALCTSSDMDIVFDVAFDMPDAPVEERSARRRIADVAFIGVTDLLPRLARMEQLREATPDEAIDECRRSIRRVLKSLAAIDVALADENQSVSSLSFSDVLLESIATRRHYARLRRAIVGFEAPQCSATARSTLERIRIHIVLLVGSDVYPVLRPSDRRQLDDLRSRIDQALAQRADSSAHLSECKRLFQDLVGFAGLVAEINRREELVEHDARVIVEAEEALGADDAIPPRLRARLDMLVGLDDEADQLIERGDWSRSAWLPVVSRLHEKLLKPAIGRYLRTRSPAASRMIG